MSKHHNHECCNTELSTSHFKYNQLNEITTTQFYVTGMDCADEVQAVQKTLNHPLISQVHVQLMNSQIDVEHSPDLNIKEIEKLIQKAGLKVRPKYRKTNFLTEHLNRILMVSASGLFLALGLTYPLVLEENNLVQLILFTVSTVLGSSLILPKAWRAIKQKSLDMNVLMILAVSGAFFIKEYSEAASVVFLFSLAEMLEAFSVSRARKAIEEVLSLAPEMAKVEENGVIKESPVESVQINQIIIVYAGDKIPIDGQIILGNSSVNQAALTGESQPVYKTIGDFVYGGTLNETSTLKIQVTKKFSDSKLSQIIQMVGEAQSQKAPAQLFVDRFAKIYTPIVTMIAIFVALIPPLFLAGNYHDWLYKALVFLVIACPCALVISTPVSIVSALTALARVGVLVKGGIFLETLAKTQAIAMDKTGTLTEGKPAVTSFKKFNDVTEFKALQLISTLEKESTHPLGKAIYNYCLSKQANPLTIESYKVIPGKGVQGLIDSKMYFLGSWKLAKELGAFDSESENECQKLMSQSQSVVILIQTVENHPNQILAIISTEDLPRKNAASALKKMLQIGIKDIVILSGDHQSTVSRIAKQLSIQSAFGELMPEGKVRHIKELVQKYKYVAMIGDGINDAPALASASVGIAMGGIGSDSAIETSDITLMTDDLSQLSIAIEHAQKSLGIIQFNISFALVTKLIFLVLGIFGFSSLWLAVAADMGATLIVIANSLRLLKINK